MMITADIAQIIAHGYASGKTVAEIAEEVAREFDRAAPSQSDGDDGITPAKRYNEFTTILDSDFESLLADRRELTSLREKLSTAEHNYLLFCKKHDEKMGKLRSALEFIADGYDNQDVNHVDFRVKAYQAAIDALKDVQ